MKITRVEAVRVAEYLYARIHTDEGITGIGLPRNSRNPDKHIWALPDWAGPPLLEYPGGEHEPPKSDIVKNAAKLQNGFLIIPDAPGIGVGLAEDAQETHPPTPANVVTKLHIDGSVVDQ